MSWRVIQSGDPRLAPNIAREIRHQRRALRQQHEQGLISSRELNIRLNEFTSIARLPDDLLTAIFYLYADLCRDDDGIFGLPENPLSHIGISHVYRRWRTVALGPPFLWNDVGTPHLESSSTMLSRSRGVALTVRFKPSTEDIRVAKHHLSPLKPRLVALEIHPLDLTDAQKWNYISSLVLNAPHLRTMIVHSERSNGTRAPLYNADILQSPNPPPLERLAFHGLRGLWTFTQLVASTLTTLILVGIPGSRRMNSLVAHCDRNELFAAIGACRALETLEMYTVGFHWDSHPHDLTGPTHPAVKRIHVQGPVGGLLWTLACIHPPITASVSMETIEPELSAERLMIAAIAMSHRVKRDNAPDERVCRHLVAFEAQFEPFVRIRFWNQIDTTLPPYISFKGSRVLNPSTLSRDTFKSAIMLCLAFSSPNLKLLSIGGGITPAITQYCPLPDDIWPRIHRRVENLQELVLEDGHGDDIPMWLLKRYDSLEETSVPMPNLKYLTLKRFTFKPSVHTGCGHGVPPQLDDALQGRGKNVLSVCLWKRRRILGDRKLHFLHLSFCKNLLPCDVDRLKLDAETVDWDGAMSPSDAERHKSCRVPTCSCAQVVQSSLLLQGVQ